MFVLRRSLLLTGFGVAVPVSRASAFVLVTPEEATADLAAPPQLAPLRTPDPQAPRIEVVRPNEGATLPSPVSITLRFTAANDARIDPDSFRVLYGRIGYDVTGRLRPYARIDANGLVAENATLPLGSHRLRVQVADTRGRVGERMFQFTVV